METGTIVAVVMGALWVASEGLAQIPQVKANSVFQLIHGILGALAGKGKE